MKNYELKSLGDISTQSRIELHEQLKLTGAEISINELPANISIPFVHKHKENEEIYLVLEGKGTLYIDKEEIEIKKADFFKITPEGERCIKASKTDPIRYICIQVKENSLNGFTQTDGIILENTHAFN